MFLLLSAPNPAPNGAVPKRIAGAATSLPTRVDRPPLLSGFLDYRASPVRDPAFEAARTINARIAFAAVPARSAPPFFISGDTADRVRATDCLAAAAYYEAGNDMRGQRAVMQVVLNRLRNPAYPRTVCGVVFQGSERRTGCQFTFTCDGAMSRHRPSLVAWQQAQRTATEALNGYSDTTVGHATHYHTDWVHPYWSRHLDKVAAVDTHLFFQANAARSGNFSSSYGGAEPRMANLSWLSPAHRTLPGTTDIDFASALSVQPPRETIGLADNPAPAAERLPDETRSPDADLLLVALDAGADPDSFLRLAQARCAGRAYCRMIGWTDARKRPDQFPIPGSAIDAISFSFSRTGPGEADKARWNCREFPRPDSGQCLNRGT